MGTFSPSNPEFFSTHLDDAALSCGHYLGAHPGTRVTTVMAGAPAIQADLTDWNRRTTGYAYAPEAVRARIIEDEAVMTALGAVARWCDVPEWSYIEGTRDPAAIDEALAASHDRDADTIVGPLGLNHPDHQAVSDGCIRLATRLGLDLVLYTDQPYGYTYPDNITERLAELAARGIYPEALEAVQPVIDKAAVCRLYASQYDLLRASFKTFDAALAAPEIYWRVPS